MIRQTVIFQILRLLRPNLEQLGYPMHCSASVVHATLSDAVYCELSTACSTYHVLISH